MSKRTEPIEAIFGHEPMREREYPASYVVGRPPSGPVEPDAPYVTKIVFRQDNYGDHGIGWFDVWAGETLVASMQARAVAEVQYGEAEQAA